MRIDEATAKKVAAQMLKDAPREERESLLAELAERLDENAGRKFAALDNEGRAVLLFDFLVAAIMISPPSATEIAMGIKRDTPEGR